MARQLGGVLLAAAVTIAAGCQTPQFPSGDPIAADGRALSSVPSDGAWVRYVVNHESTSHPYRSKKAKSGAKVETDRVKSWSEKITLSFVGTTEEDGVRCRWVEVRKEDPEQQADKPCAYKMLLKEQALLSHKDPLSEANVVRVWQQMPDGTVSPRDDAPNCSVLFSWTPGVVRHMKPEEGQKEGQTREIDFASGHLSGATAYAGKTTTNARIALGVIRIHFEDHTTVWLHPDLPAGFAALRLQQNATARFVMKPAGFDELTEYVLEDAGTNAQTSMPDHI